MREDVMTFGYTMSFLVMMKRRLKQPGVNTFSTNNENNALKSSEFSKIFDLF